MIQYIKHNIVEGTEQYVLFYYHYCHFSYGFQLFFLGVGEKRLVKGFFCQKQNCYKVNTQGQGQLTVKGSSNRMLPRIECFIDLFQFRLGQVRLRFLESRKHLFQGTFYRQLPLIQPFFIILKNKEGSLLCKIIIIKSYQIRHNLISRSWLSFLE